MNQLQTHPKVQGILDFCKENREVGFLEEMVESYPGVTDRNKKEIRYFAKIKLKGLQELAKTLHGAEEAEIDSAISSVWFEFRSEWIRHNAVNNYNMFMYGQAEPIFVLQSSVLSYYIAEIEKFIPEDRLEKMNEIMVNLQYSMG